MLKINIPLSCKRNWNILFFNRYNYELIQTTQNSSFEEKEIIYIFAPDGLTAIYETVIRHCKFQIGNCKF